MEAIIKEVKPTLSQASIKNYLTNLNKIYKSLNIKDKDITNLKWIYQRKKIMDFINSLKTPNTRKTYFSNIITLLMYDKDNTKQPTELQFYIKEAKNNQDNIKLKQKTNNQLEDKLIDMKEYDKLISLVSKDKTLSREYLQLLLLKELPIRNELSTLILIKNQDYQKLSKEDIMTNNYLINGQKIRVSRSNYKTAKLYGTIITEITDKKLKQVLRKYIKENNITNNTPLFIYKDKPQTQNELSQRLSYVSNRLINTKLSTSSIFKIVLNHIINNEPNDQKKIDMIKNKGMIRGTDYTTLINYYVFNQKQNKPIDTDEEDNK
tara:strand:+ start:9 stop:971 length:963 start_codon:yes stop_codon:yes gene_type:complete